jgi:CTP-dependent riboflavin kinase
MNRNITVKGTYSQGSGWVSSNWENICSKHEEEFPRIRHCYPGTFNIKLDSPYEPPDENNYKQRASNYLSPRAKVIEINGNAVEMWIYRGGHPNTILELVLLCQLAHHLSLCHGAAITATILELSDEGEDGMPSPPPKNV